MAADEATTRLEDVQRVTDAALAYLDLDDLLDALLQRVTDILHADTAAVLLVEDDGRTLAARAAKGLEEEVERVSICRSDADLPVAWRRRASPWSSPISTTRPSRWSTR